MEARSEVQLRTLGQHMWADVYHEMGYKNEFQLPARWQREFARAAALLENVDLVFQETRAALGTYESAYGAYMTQEQLDGLANRLDILLDVETQNFRAAHRLIRASLALDKNRRRALFEKRQPLLEEYPPGWRDLGFAYTKVYDDPASEKFAHGQWLLRKAIERDPRDVDAHCTLGGTYRKQENFNEALRCYRAGYQVDPANPYALGNYIVEQLIRDKDTDLLNVFHGVIRGALERCYKMIEVRVNFPWALYDLAMFLLYQGELSKSYLYLATGIDKSSEDWMVQTTAATIARLVASGVSIKGAEQASRILALGEQVKSGKRGGPKGDEAPLFRSPLVILAGGCGDLIGKDLEMVKILPCALAGFRGTLVSGGTDSGIAAIPGNLQREALSDQLVTIGYAPGDLHGERIHSGYSKIVRTSGEDFSVLEPVTFWEDFWKAGGKPAEVKLIGFNGGRIAALEYRLALALGAQVGVVRGSGREADLLLSDPLWKDHPRLHALDPSEESVRRFLMST
jgi:tetratricopeptide (TPR) repeat protein